MSTGSFPESLSQAILAGTILVGRLGVVGVSSECEVLSGKKAVDTYVKRTLHCWWRRRMHRRRTCRERGRERGRGDGEINYNHLSYKYEDLTNQYL